MALYGDIRTMPVTDLFQWIETTVKTGIFELRREGAWRKIFFQGGQILFASSSSEHEKLGRFLIRRGKLDEQALMACLDESERTGEKLTAILEARKLLTHGELYDEVVLLVKEILFDLFLWEDGEFRFTDRELPQALEGPLALKTGQVLFQVLTRIDEKRRDGDKLPGAEPEEHRSTPNRKRRGRVVFKVDNRKFTLPGEHEHPQLCGLERQGDPQDEEAD
jgi:hypothetical protein